MKVIIVAALCVFVVDSANGQTVTYDTARVSPAMQTSRPVQNPDANEGAQQEQKGMLLAGDMDGDGAVLREGAKLYHIVNDSERILLLKRPGVDVMDTLDVQDAGLPLYWSLGLENDFKRYAVFHAACGSNCCHGAVVLDKPSGKFVWWHWGLLDIDTSRDEGEIIYTKGKSVARTTEIRIHSIAWGLTETYPLPKDLLECPQVECCINSVRTDRKYLWLTYNPEDGSGEKTVVFKRRPGKIVHDEENDKM